jgi:nucleotide-binding universal stress UspA family protein
MPDIESANRMRAIQDFREARRKAALESILAFIQGKSTDLMSYEQVRESLRPIESARRMLEDIPLDRIVGSVNRTTDFSRSFLPRHESDAYRWASVRAGVESMVGLPPIDAYRVGDLYFILDGHHRVSVARELGQKTIQGNVIPVYTRVPLSPRDSPDDFIIKSEYADFLARTQIDHFRPEADLMVSVPGQYEKLLEHINVHRYFLGQNRNKEVSEKEAIADWFDAVYLPIVRLIRERNLLRDFPDRTEADLYLWIMDYRSLLSQGGIGWEVAPGKAVTAMIDRYSPIPQRRLPRLARQLARIVVPETLESGPPAGSWRSERQSPHRGDHLFDDILVTLLGGTSGQTTLNLALAVAAHEDARLTGLHVLSSEAQIDSPEVKALRENFLYRCAEKNIFGRIVTDTGQAAHLLCQRSPWVDLSVFRLAHPPSQQIHQRLHSGVRYLIRHCVSPLLAVPDSSYQLDSALLAYGPGRKSEEALFVAAYLAGRWKIPLTVVSVTRGKSVIAPGLPNPLDRARSYLGTQGIEATYILEKMGDPTLAVLLNAEVHNVGFIITGSYEAAPLRESLFGSNVDRILRSTRRPVLICR